MHRSRIVLSLVAALVACVVPLAIAAAVHPTPMDWRHLRFEQPSYGTLRRIEALSGRAGEIQERDERFIASRAKGAAEVEFLAQYERLRTEAGADAAHDRQCRMLAERRRIGGDIEDAQALANETGQPVDVIVC